MTGPLPTAVIAVALAVAAWGLLTAALRRAPGPVHWIAVGLLQAATLTLVGLAVAGLVGGHRPAELAVFLGYLFTVTALPAAAGVLAWMEPTRWGSAIIGFGGLVVPVLVVRLQQVWAAAHG